MIIMEQIRAAKVCKFCCKKYYSPSVSKSNLLKALVSLLTKFPTVSVRYRKRMATLETSS